MSALPFSATDKTVPRYPKNYPREPKTIGEHILKARIERRLSKEAAAGEMGVSVHMLEPWQKGKNFPQVKILKKIIDFLGYYPLPEPSTFGERARKYRQVHGLTLNELALRLHVTKSTVAAWEKGRTVTDEKAVLRMNELLNAKEPST